jgi:formylglycine-generating enzyme required for sulfatase activity
MRPVENIAYNEFRNSDYRTATCVWPNPPTSGSFLDLLNARTGLDFDLPSEAQWEFAARAGNGDTRWGDGSTIVLTNESGNRDANLALLGRYQFNAVHSWWESTVDYACGAEDGTATVGSYRPNNWGLYDMHGNVLEWCLDWYQTDVTEYYGRVNVNIVDPVAPLSGTASNRVLKGGAWSKVANQVRPAFRLSQSPSVRNGTTGVRLVCTAGLQ